MNDDTDFTCPGNKEVGPRPLPPIPPPELDAFPEALKQHPNWVVYKAPIKTKADGTRKYDKVPFNPKTGKPASSADSSTWGTFDEAVAAYKKGGYAGLGFQLRHETNIIGIDLDKCRDTEGNWHPEAEKLVKRMNSYTELSPSGNGLHIFVEASLPGVTSNKYTTGFPFPVELFASNFFLTVTGLVNEETPVTVETRKSELKKLYKELEASKVSQAVNADAPDGLKSIEEFEKNILPKLGWKGGRSKTRYQEGQIAYRYEIICPWHTEHTGGGDTACVFYSEAGVPGFKCFHAHCADRKWRDVADKAGLPTASYIDELNEQFAVAVINGSAVILQETFNESLGKPDIQFMGVSDFGVLMRNEFITVRTDGGVIELGKADLWLKSRRRRTFRNGVTFDPSGKLYKESFNMWRGFGIEPAKGDWSLLRDHIFNIICRGNEEHYEYLMAWLARVVQDPGGERPGVAVVLRGGQGTGKGVVCDGFGQIIGPHYLHLARRESLVGRFNSHLKDVLVLFADEALFAGDRSSVGMLKRIITERSLEVEPKGVNTFTVPNFLNLMMASNEEWVIPAEVDERRFFVLDVLNERQQDHGYFKALFSQMQAGGLAAWMYDLLELDIRSINLRAPPKTDALKAQQRHSLDSVAGWWQSCCDEGRMLLADEDGKLVERDWPDSEENSVDKDEVYAGYQRYCDERRTQHRHGRERFWPRMRELVEYQQAQPNRDGERRRVIWFTSARPQIEPELPF
ncbi:MAG TPA: DUF5906 domain-containing protein [Kiritimatiellia bacterium]|nr:DUF5906 domain-containing protein [Kiritimatiellia bacterium]